MAGGTEYKDRTIAPADPCALWVNSNISPPIANPTGTFDAPFATIQAALDEAGVPTSATDQLTPWTIFVVGGAYDQDLVIPPYRSVNIIALGLVILGLSSISRTVTIDLPAGAPFPGAVVIGISDLGAPDVFKFACDQIIATSADSQDLELQLTGVNCRGATAPGIDASGLTGGGEGFLYLDRSAIFSQDPSDLGIYAILGPDDTATPTRRALVMARLTESVIESKAATPANQSAIYASLYAHIESCRVNGNVTFTGDDGNGALDPNASHPSGWYDCKFNPTAMTWTGTLAGDFWLDETSYYQFDVNSCVLAGPSTFNHLSMFQGRGSATVAAQTQSVSAPGATGGLVLATISIDDSGGTLGGVVGAFVSAPGIVDVIFANAPSNNDGVVNVLVIKD